MIFVFEAGVGMAITDLVVFLMCYLDFLTIIFPLLKR